MIYMKCSILILILMTIAIAGCIEDAADNQRLSNITKSSYESTIEPTTKSQGGSDWFLLSCG